MSNVSIEYLLSLRAVTAVSVPITVTAFCTTSEKTSEMPACEKFMHSAAFCMSRMHKSSTVVPGVDSSWYTSPKTDSGSVNQPRVGGF